MDSFMVFLYYFKVSSLKRFFTKKTHRLLSIHGVGLREGMKPGMVNRPHGTNDYLFMYFYDPVWIEVEGSLRKFQKGRLMVWRPGERHHYGNPNRRWNHTWIHMDGPSIHSLILENEIPCSHPFQFVRRAMMEKSLFEIYHEMALESACDIRIIQNHVENWIWDLVRTLRTKHRKQNIPERFQLIKRFLEEHYHEWIYLNDLAKRFHLSSPHLCSTFKRFFGASPLDFVIRLRMQQAVYLLSDHNLNITEIAERVGYDDPYYFSKLFKKHYQESPLKFRHRFEKQKQRLL